MSVIKICNTIIRFPNYHLREDNNHSHRTLHCVGQWAAEEYEVKVICDRLRNFQGTARIHGKL